VLEQLLAAPQLFAFGQAVRILHHAYGGERDVITFMREDLRIRPNLSLGFPPSDIFSLENLSLPEQRRFLMTVNMLGLYGASSPLPLFYTETLLDEQAEDRSAMRDFVDVIGDGLFSLFLWASRFRYRALFALTDRGDDRLMGQLSALGGSDYLMSAGYEGLLQLNGLLSQHPRSAATLQAFLQTLLGVSVRIEECVLYQFSTPVEQRACLGVDTCLGRMALLGTRARDLGSKIGICLERLQAEEWRSFVPGAPGFVRLCHLVGVFCYEQLVFDLHLVMDRDADMAAVEKRGLGVLNGDTWLGDGTQYVRQVVFPDCEAHTA
jgi:type VI secretion system protein ImpH